MTRISVVGNSGSGKSTFAKNLARTLRCTHIELDSIFHQPNWSELPADEFRRIVEERTSNENWVACGNYRQVIDIVWKRADTIIVFDLPRRVVMWRVVKRTVRRWLTREELWNGNHEPFRNFISLHNPEKSIISWAWTKHSHYHRLFHAAAESDSTDTHWVFFTSRRDAQKYLDHCSDRT